MNQPIFRVLTKRQPINLKLLTLIADRNRYPRLLATNGQEALDTYKSSIEAGRHVGPDQASQDNASPECKPSVVLLDLNMPVMDGFEAARQIRLFEKKIGVSPAVIVAITGLGDGVARARAYEHGVNLFLSKPVRPQDLTEMLNSIVNAKDE